MAEVAGEAGKFKIRNVNEGFAIRNRIKHAADVLGINVKIRKIGNETYFWKLKD